MHSRPLKLPRRPATAPHQEPRETEFVSLLLAEIAKPAAPVTAAPVVEDDDDDFPAYMRDDYPHYVSAADLDAPVRFSKRKF